MLSEQKRSEVGRKQGFGGIQVELDGRRERMPRERGRENCKPHKMVRVVDLFQAARKAIT